MKWEELYDGLDEGVMPDYVAEINHPRYGKYIWITEDYDGWHVKYNSGCSELVTIKVCKSHISAKRWVSMNIRGE